MDYDYDVIVVGCGPAGSTFARQVASGGMNVLMVDKRKQIGIPVRCGEGLGEREVVKEGIDLPKEVISTDIVGARVVAPNGKDIVWKSDETKGWVLERKMFDQFLSELAVDAGAKVIVYTRAVDVIRENGKPCGVMLKHGDEEPYEVRAPLIVSAEGMEALIARRLGFDTVHKPYDVDTCYEYEMQGYEHENLIELFFGNQIAPRGYVWIFPKKNNKANVGIGIGGTIFNGVKQGGMKGCAPKPLLDEFIERHEVLRNASKLNDFGGVISVGAPINEFVKDNCLVIGTAAKQVDPIHGGGIALAMEAGMMASSVVLDAFENGKDYSKEKLQKYEDIWRAGPGKKLEKRLLLRKVMEKVNDDDLNHIFNTITDSDLNNIMAGKFAGPVAKVLATRPQLLKVLGALVS